MLKNVAFNDLSLTVFATKAAREMQISFEICTDLFYSEENMAHLRKVAADADWQDAERRTFFSSHLLSDSLAAANL